MSPDSGSTPSTSHKRRPRYSGKNPRRFDQKYKERDPHHHPETVAKVLASGKTPAGTHRPIMVAEILEALQPAPGDFAVDCTLGYGGHARAILERISPGGRLLGIDADPIEMARTEERLRKAGFGPDMLLCSRSNFAALPKILAGEPRSRADLILADLGVSSMQIDDPTRGFSVREDGPLDMRMNPQRGQSAAALLSSIRKEALVEILTQNADEPFAVMLAEGLAGRTLRTTRELASAVRLQLRGQNAAAIEGAVRRVFQAIRIEVNDEFGVLDVLLRQLPEALAAGGRVAVLSFHSGEDRRVKKAFEQGLRAGVYARVAPGPIQAGPGERRENTRSSSAKLRWAVRA